MPCHGGHASRGERKRTDDVDERIYDHEVCYGTDAFGFLGCVEATLDADDQDGIHYGVNYNVSKFAREKCWSM